MRLSFSGSILVYVCHLVAVQHVTVLVELVVVSPGCMMLTAEQDACQQKGSYLTESFPFPSLTGAPHQWETKQAVLSIQTESPSLKVGSQRKWKLTVNIYYKSYECKLSK